MSAEPARATRRSLLRKLYVVGTTALVSAPVVAAASIPRPGWASTPGAEPVGTLSGRVWDVLTDQPVSGARVVARPGGIVSTTNARGEYIVSLPAGSHTIEVTSPGYIGTSRLDQIVRIGATALSLELIPAHPTLDQQKILYDRLVKQAESPLVGLGEQRRTQNWSGLVSVPTTIMVYYDQSNPPYTVPVPIEDYVKGVVPNEAPASWPASSLQAQAVAARSYGVASQIANGFVYPDTRSQLYDPTYRTATTDAAVDATAGVIMTYAGSVIHAYFFSRCNGVATHNSENATILDPTNLFHCIPAGWNYVAYCRARSCTVHPAYTGDDCGYYGHGVGMCQWGTYYRSLNGESYQSILNDYYNGVGFFTIPLGSPNPAYQLALPVVGN